MPIDEQLTPKVRRLLIKHLPDGLRMSDIREKKMFGGLAFMVKDKMCVTISGREGCDVMARIGEAAVDEALKHEGVRQTVIRGKIRQGYVDLYDQALEELEYWIILALQHNLSLPDKTPRTKNRAKRPRTTP